MHKKRKLSSGCFLRGKFYVIGGLDENDKHLACGESYDEVADSWELIPDMLKDMAFMFLHSPPLIAMVEDSLYTLDTFSNELSVYNINTNTWTKLGGPVVADIVGVLGVPLKSSGDRLMMMMIGVPLSFESMYCDEINGGFHMSSVYKCHGTAYMGEVQVRRR